MTARLGGGYLFRHPFRSLTSASQKPTSSLLRLVHVNSVHFNAFKEIKNSPILPKHGLWSSSFRQFSKLTEQEVSQKTLERLRIRDGVPKSYRLVYNSTYPNYLLMSQTCVCLVIGSVIFGTAIHFTMEQLTEEQEAAERELRARIALEEKIRKNQGSDLMQMVEEFREKYEIQGPLSQAGIEDVVQVEGYQILLILFSFVSLAVGMFKIQRMLPVRVYANEKTRHCIAIMYGHILPGKLTWHEFLPGSLKPYKGQTSDNAIFKDAAGKTLILMEHYFRSPKDYNFVFGYDNHRDR